MSANDLFFLSGSAIRYICCASIKPISKGDFLRAGNFFALAFFYGPDEASGIQKRGMGAGVEPARAAAEQFHLEIAALEISLVDIRNFKFAASGRFYLFCDCYHVVVVKYRPVTA